MPGAGWYLAGGWVQYVTGSGWIDQSTLWNVQVHWTDATGGWSSPKGLRDTQTRVYE